MSSDPAANAYLATKILTATPEQLRLMLLEGALKFCRQGRDGLANKNYEAVFNGFSRCRAILVELVTTMKPEPDRQLYDRLSSLYLFMMSRLMESSHERSIEKADEVIKLLDYERETWVMLIEKVTEMR
jgi:flagellar protein FliS